jgi:hypothetical protein
MIPPPIIDNNTFGIPIYKSNEFCFLTWKDGETFQEMMKRNQNVDSISKYDSFETISSDDELDISFSFQCAIYDVICEKSNKIFYLVVNYPETFVQDDIYDWICIPRNRLNLMKFYIEYFIPFCNKKFLR